jgi:hypothetical protein
MLNFEYWDLQHISKFRNNKIFVSPMISGYPLNDLYPYEKLWVTRPQIDFVKELNLTSKIQEADYVLVPHDWRTIRNDIEYIKVLNSLSEKIPIIILNLGDKASECSLRNCIQIRTHLWPWEDLNRKILIPYPTVSKKLVLRKWKPIPTISFMGYIPRLGPRSFFGKSYKGLSKPIKSSVYLTRHISIFRLGKLQKKFDIRITKRREFTAYMSNPNLIQHTAEYESLLAESDYVLCPRGESNTSIRFYETLSSGSTPLLIDTDGGLPKLPPNIEWKNHILELGLFSNWDEAIIKDWSNLSNGQNYLKRQLNNYNFFTNQLTITNYLNALFEDYLKINNS